MSREHSPFYKKCPSTYKVSIYQYKKSKDEDFENMNPVISFCCAYCKMWDTCETENTQNNNASKREVCYIAKEVEDKMAPFTVGFSSGLSNSDFMVKTENQNDEKSIDKIRKRLLKKYKMR